MWPFSTIRNLRLELAQAETGNATLRGMINRLQEDVRITTRQIGMRESDIAELKRLLEQETTTVKFVTKRYDEALTQRNILNMSCNGLREILQGAMIRDPKTGRMTRWVDPREQVLTP